MESLWAACADAASYPENLRNLYPYDLNFKSRYERLSLQESKLFKPENEASVDMLELRGNRTHPRLDEVSGGQDRQISGRKK